MEPGRVVVRGLGARIDTALGEERVVPDLAQAIVEELFVRQLDDEVGEPLVGRRRRELFVRRITTGERDRRLARGSLVADQLDAELPVAVALPLPASPELGDERGERLVVLGVRLEDRAAAVIALTERLEEQNGRVLDLELRVVAHAVEVRAHEVGPRLAVDLELRPLRLGDTAGGVAADAGLERLAVDLRGEILARARARSTAPTGRVLVLSPTARAGAGDAEHQRQQRDGVPS